MGRKYFINKSILVVAAITSVFLTACGNKNNGADNKQEEQAQADIISEDGKGTENRLDSFGIKDIEADRFVKIPLVDSALTVHGEEDIFDSFLWGTFKYENLIPGKNELGEEGYQVDLESFNNGMDFTRYKSEKNTFSTLPYRITAEKAYKKITHKTVDAELRRGLEEMYGQENSEYFFNLYKNISRASLEFAGDDSQSNISIKAFYYVDRDKIYFFTGEEPTFNPKDGEIYEYGIKALPGGIVLSANGIDRTLMAESGMKETDLEGRMISFSGNPSGKNQIYKDYKNISVFKNLQSQENKAQAGAYVFFMDGGYAEDPVVTSFEGGNVKIKWTRELRPKDGHGEVVEKSNELDIHIIDSGNDGMIITDNGRRFLYQTSDADFQAIQLDGMLAGNESVSGEKISLIMGKQTEIKQKLQEEFVDSGEKVSIDDVTGIVTMNSSVLFDVGSAELSADGKKTLDQFFNQYVDVVLDEEFDDVVEYISVEGHTDTTGNYDYNLELSERRAQVVVDYCNSINPNVREKIRSKGRSYDSPVYDSNGQIDMEASRRVEFKFVMSVD